jgi:flagellar biosynthesis protein FlhB
VAEGADEEDKTEQLSARRMQQAFEEGQRPMGREAIALASMIAGVAALTALGGPLKSSLVTAIAAVARGVHTTNFRELPRVLMTPALLGLAVCAAMALGAAIATLAQTRGDFLPHLVLPDFGKLFGSSKILRVFSAQFWTELGLNLLKVAAIGYVAYLGLRDEFLALSRAFLGTPDAQLTAVFAPLAKTAVKVLTTMAVFAGLDLALTHRRFRSQMKMTKEEAKREARDEDGDPTVRGKRKKRHREIVRGRAAFEVPRADALVVNPTHVAIALRYRKDEGAAPRVTAKGKGKLAEIMRDLARENAVPIVQDIALARLLYKKVKVGRQVPAETYRAVAAILAFVYRITGRQVREGAVR